MKNKNDVGASLLSEKLASETARAEQLGKNCMWLIAKIDRIHAALCQGENGTWQMRAEQAVNAAERMAANVELTGARRASELNAKLGVER